MSTIIESIYGSRWEIAKSETTGEVAIDSRDASGNRVFKVSDLLEALEREGLLEDRKVDAVEIITELPEVTKDNLPGWVIAGGITMSTKDGAEWHRKLGLNHLAVSRYLEAEDIAKAEAAGKLAARRDDLANQLLNPSSWQSSEATYRGVSPALRRAVDIIIEMEDTAAEAA